VIHATTTLTIMAMLWHSIAGCCAHHDHASANPVATDACSSISVVRACDHFAASQSCQTERQDSPDSPVDCSDAVCVYSLSSNDSGMELSKCVEMLPSFNVGCESCYCSAELKFGRERCRSIFQSAGGIFRAWPVFICFLSLLL